MRSCKQENQPEQKRYASLGHVIAEGGLPQKESGGPKLTTIGLIGVKFHPQHAKI